MLVCGGVLPLGSSLSVKYITNKGAKVEGESREKKKKRVEVFFILTAKSSLLSRSVAINTGSKRNRRELIFGRRFPEKQRLVSVRLQMLHFPSLNDQQDDSAEEFDHSSERFSSQVVR